MHEKKAPTLWQGREVRLIALPHLTAMHDPSQAVCFFCRYFTSRRRAATLRTFCKLTGESTKPQSEMCFAFDGGAAWIS